MEDVPVVTQKERSLDEYSKELKCLNDDIKALKAKFYDRASRRGKLGRTEGLSEDFFDWHDPAQREAVKRLEVLAAEALLDVSTTLPVSVDVLHKRVSCALPGQTLVHQAV
jgi:uncharacterized protein YutE (UPF0331/DUF86 family)